jgi:hypothetical protein
MILEGTKGEKKIGDWYKNGMETKLRIKVGRTEQNTDLEDSDGIN